MDSCNNQAQKSGVSKYSSAILAVALVGTFITLIVGVTILGIKFNQHASSKWFPQYSSLSVWHIYVS